MNEVLLVIIEAITIMARWLSWLERRPVTAEVVGSNPIRGACESKIIYGILAQLGEHLPYKQRVTGSSPTRGANLIRPHGQAVKTSPFHGGNTSSNLVGVI